MMLLRDRPEAIHLRNSMCRASLDVGLLVLGPGAEVGRPVVRQTGRHVWRYLLLSVQPDFVVSPTFVMGLPWRPIPCLP